MSVSLTTPAAFIDHWQKAEANERANSQSFLIGLAHILGVPAPSNSHASGYSFEFPVKVPGAESTNFIDLYRRAHFVLESKQFAARREELTALERAAIDSGALAAAVKKSGPVRGTGAWDDAMIRAKGQAERYVRSLPAEEPNPPFIIVCDVGNSFEVYADFTQNGKAYLPFPDPRSFRIRLRDLEDEKVRERLRLIWTNPAALDPAKVSAEVTREIAGYLAELAKSLEQEKHDPEVVAQFLTRCLFCMFAEDVGLLPGHAFTKLLHEVPADGTGFPELLSTVFREMNTGTGKSISVVLRQKLLQFNGGLFADHTVLPVNGLQLGLLKQAASKQWKNVEPAIFGTLLERALVPEERHALGAHFTPRAYVERLVLPTLIEPLREEWENVRAAAITHANKGDLKNARAVVNAFHDKLCRIRVLDPACGSGNFLYVALQHLKILEGEVLDFAAQFGEDMKLELETHTIDPHQFLGIELNPRAASIAELVLWIGYLQWHFKIHGQRIPPEPILRAFKNIECRDAVLDYDGEPQPARDADGHIRTVWDRRSTKTDLVTNRDVPDETKRVPLMTYANPRPAEWPGADFIVGNPPYIGVRRLKDSIGDAYVETVRAVYPEVPETCDYVMYWWEKAARAVESGITRRFGLITTNSIVQAYSRRLLDKHIGTGGKLKVVFAVPDHPWVDAADGAAVRVALTVGCSISENATASLGVAGNGETDAVTYTHPERIGSTLDASSIHERFSELQSNTGICFQGVVPAGDGFKLDADELIKLGFSSSDLPPVIRRYIIGKDLVQQFETRYIIDFFGLSAAEARHEYPTLYQRLLNQVYPERAENKRASYKEKWWIFAEPRPALRRGLNELKRFIVTPYTAKHRPFIFVDGDTLPDAMAYAIASEDAFVLGVLSSRHHLAWALSAGGTLEDRPRYNSNATFLPFPFPLCGEAEKARIRAVAEALDAHRKRVQAQHPDLTLTGLYNVLEKLRASRSASMANAYSPLLPSAAHIPTPTASAHESQASGLTTHTRSEDQALTAKERDIHDRGLVSLLKQLHDDLDAAVFAAYGWPATLTDAEILTRLVTLNAQRAEEEKRGIIHWLRPEYQNAAGKKVQTQDTLDLPTKKKPHSSSVIRHSSLKQPWPKPLAERIRATEQVLHAAGTPVTAADLTQAFSRAKPADLQEILESLVTLGRAHQDGERFSV